MGFLHLVLVRQHKNLRIDQEHVLNHVKALGSLSQLEGVATLSSRLGIWCLHLVYFASKKVGQEVAISW
ncbi:hypothetical protein HOLleu_15910 [Holothuria leucospilota]|uniref:Uncharacterized protein n=1 Tax=Holothuria leucospilota TaxID=206669 RepID=A0A9Q1H9Z6_HOLLE|nr:hypothetical protein HOLleu_15910 [Holothuria leucospilota]